MSGLAATRTGSAENDEPDEGLKIALSAAQLAAVLENEDLEPGGTLGNRLIGGLRLLGCGGELIGAGALLLAPEPTMVTKVGGVALGAHGVDQCITGGKQIWTGKDVRSFTDRGVSALAENLGASPGAARNAGLAAEIMVPVGGALLANAVRTGAIRGGRIVLLRHEATNQASRLGGHTIARHVGRTEAQLRQRLVDTAASRRPMAMVSTFDDLAIAERSITRGLQVHKNAIRSWAQSGANTNLVLDFPFGREVGFGIARASGQVQRLSKIKIVLKRETYNGMPHYILTAYPI
ncbi:hypothetical protein J2T09_001809 [Neorhizobium huautlense]|uniref:Bacterial CdiA-CT RNAse A domain-containing protein n=1 Tax=Neorhizobium huautlense TaxID=67774 RepID=A0ABT9PRH1_9HYPH|nr:RNase A-like domain-containing protein [Neorhizobium huautlense]MDP9837057.1 hypothetical protein [Neorhizobium huautlense]